MNFKSAKWLIPGLLILIILAVGIFVKVAFDTNVFGSDFRRMVLGTFQKNPFRKQSEVKVSLIDSRLNMNFDLLEEDKPKFAKFINNWFGATEERSLPSEVKNLNFGIDENTKHMISQSLPVTLKLAVSEKSLAFGNNSLSGLQNPLIKNSIDFATGSGKLNAQFSDTAKYSIKLENPEDLANYATSSGMLTASDKLAPLFKSLPKVATIELNVNGKSISGEIVLR